MNELAVATLAAEHAAVGSADRSLVAGVNALFRAVESRRPAAVRLLDDPFGALFAESDPRVQLIRVGRFFVPALGRMVEELQTAHCVRHRAIDALVLRAVEEGFRQVVVVGAGYDMRVSRFAPALRGVRWIEADHPATQRRKERLLARARPGGGAVRVGLDLLRDSLATVLTTTAYDPALPTCFVLEGLIHYLTRPRLEPLFAAMRGPAPRRAILSFIRNDMYSAASPLFGELVKALREVPRLHFHPAELAGLCARHGLPRFRSWAFAEQVRELAPEACGRPANLSQDVAQADGA